MARRELEELFWRVGSDFQSLNDEFASVRPKVANARFWEPNVDLLEEAHRFLIRVEIAGVRGEDIHLEYVPDRHAVVLRGVRQHDSFTDGEALGAHQLEIFFGEFLREVRLPDIAIDASGIRAQYRNGFLLIMVPKLDRVVVRKIKISKA